MPALENPKHEAVAREYVALLEDKTQRPSLTKAYQNVYGASRESADAHAYEVGKSGVKNRIQEILDQQLGLTDNFLLTFGRDKFLQGQDLGIAHKAWRTFLEIKGIINQEQSVSIASINFNKVIVEAPQVYDESASAAQTSDNMHA